MLSHIKRSIYLVCGIISLLLGVVGIFLPLLPTTPFVLLAAYCFSNSSERLHQWLLNHKYLGSIIREWEMYGVIRTKIKWIATLSIILMVSYPVLFVVPYVWLKLTIVGTISLVLLFIWSRPSVPVQTEPEQVTLPPNE